MSLKPVKKQSLSESVFEQLRDHIIAGAVEPGEALPAERVLADKLGVNRQAVREGLKRLEQAGLVAIQQGGATRVLNFKQTGGLELLAAMILTPDGNIHTGVVRSVLEMRASLGPEAARLCARRTPELGKSALNTHIHAMDQARDASDLETLADLALRFWGEIVSGSHNLAYQLAFNALDKTYRQVMQHLTQLIAAELLDVEGCRAIADAIGDGDEARARAAAAALVHHGTQAVEALLLALDEEL